MTPDQILSTFESIDWISVRDHPPPTDEPIVYMVYEHGRPHGVGIAYWTVSKTWNPEMQSIRYPEGFTHWIPLPRPKNLLRRH